MRDQRDEPFRLAALFDRGVLTAPERKRQMTLRLPWVGDQGESSMCVGFSGEAWQRTTPSIRSRVSLDASGYYRGAQMYDEWPGEGYEGSSLRGLMEFMLAHPDVDLRSYRHVTNVEELLAWFNQAETPLTPPVIGVNWYEEMFKPGEGDLLSVGGDVAGGHALVVVGYRTLRTGAVQFLLHNSWGRDWGNRGRAWIGDSDLGRLLNEDGECMIGTKVPREA